ncbi:MAG: SDR family NAD(P)-dependent oxidoreductase, partial [Chitinophagaceae bacterium]|nr:SDR family NAD(P)-dependent oxidoreductase [Chitinophagaceae bacterium]
MFTLKNKIAVVTGGGSGIGRAIATTFAKQGATVHILEMDLDAANAVVNDINKMNGKAFAQQCNVSVQKEVLDVFENIGAIDMLINNAG